MRSTTTMMLIRLLVLVIVLSLHYEVVFGRSQRTEQPTPLPEAETDTSEASSSSSSSDASTPIPTASVDSSTFQLVNNVVCNDTVAMIVSGIYSLNRAIFDTCVSDSGYQIFPYSGTVPTAEDTTGMVTSESCIAIFIAVVQLDMPACSITDMPLRATCETLLYYTIELEEGAEAPTPEEFHAVLAWRRDSDAAKTAGVPYDEASDFYAKFEQKLLLAENKYDYIHVLSDLTIQIRGVVPENDPSITFASVSQETLSEIAAMVQSSSTTVSNSSSGSKLSDSSTDTADTSTSSSLQSSNDGSGVSVNTESAAHGAAINVIILLGALAVSLGNLG